MAGQDYIEFWKARSTWLVLISIAAFFAQFYGIDIPVEGVTDKVMQIISTFAAVFAYQQRITGVMKIKWPWS